MTIANKSGNGEVKENWVVEALFSANLHILLRKLINRVNNPIQCLIHMLLKLWLKLTFDRINIPIQQNLFQMVFLISFYLRTALQMLEHKPAEQKVPNKN